MAPRSVLRSVRAIAPLVLAGVGCGPEQLDSAGEDRGEARPALDAEDRQRFPDFDGDGYSDLPMGAPFESSNRTEDGSVTVVYGGPDGLSTAGAQKWTLDSPGVPGLAGDFDHFGSALAWGDFNDDGASDLAVGIPSYGIGGAVLVLFGNWGPHGTGTGLGAQNAKLFTLNSFGRTPKAADGFGAALVALNLTADGPTDLAVGIPGRDGATTLDDGAVQVLRGDPSGEFAFSSYIQPYATFEPSEEGASLTSFHKSWFGAALAAGDADADGDDDLAIGAPQARHIQANFSSYAGAFTVVHFSTPSGRCYGIERLSPGEHTGARKGSALAMGDFDGDGTDDLAVGSPASGSGAVDVYWGEPTFDDALCEEIGIRDGVPTYFRQGTGPIHGHARAGDAFGASLAAADFDDDGDDELAIGAPGDDRLFQNEPEPLDKAGVVRIAQLSPVGNYAQALTQFIEEVPGAPAGNDQFGYTLLAGDFDRKNGADLAVGIPGDRCAPYTTVRGGSYEVFFSDGGSDSNTLSTFGVQMLHQDKGDPPNDIPDQCEPNDRFGMVVGFIPKEPVDPGLPGL
jgi:hypothetical protein